MKWNDEILFVMLLTPSNPESKLQVVTTAQLTLNLENPHPQWLLMLLHPPFPLSHCPSSEHVRMRLNRFIRALKIHPHPCGELNWSHRDSKNCCFSISSLPLPFFHSFARARHPSCLSRFSHPTFIQTPLTNGSRSNCSISHFSLINFAAFLSPFVLHVHKVFLSCFSESFLFLWVIKQNQFTCGFSTSCPSVSLQIVLRRCSELTFSPLSSVFSPSSSLHTVFQSRNELKWLWFCEQIDEHKGVCVEIRLLVQDVLNISDLICLSTCTYNRFLFVCLFVLPAFTHSHKTLLWEQTGSVSCSRTIRQVDHRGWGSNHWPSVRWMNCSSTEPPPSRLFVLGFLGGVLDGSLFLFWNSSRGDARFEWISVGAQSPVCWVQHANAGVVFFIQIPINGNIVVLFPLGQWDEKDFF